jgi:hypothetical protein
MPTRYRICIIVPRGYKHSQAFAEVALLLKAGLIDCGHQCDMTCNKLSEDAVNIILGYHFLNHDASLARYRYIPYQLEQLSSSRVWTEQAAAVLGGAEAVWDYSQENIDFLDQHNITAKLLPLGYHAVLERIPHAAAKDVDILFFGSRGGRRTAVLDSLTAADDIATKLLFGAYGLERDAWIGRARIVLNVHFYSATIFEAVRVSYLLNNRCCVISEESPLYPYKGVDLCRVPYERLMETCREYLRQPDLMAQDAERCAAQFKQLYRMTDLLQRVIGS